MKENKSFLERILLSKINRKLTLIFLIVGIIAPIASIFYLYVLSVNNLPSEALQENSDTIASAAMVLISLIAIDAAIIGYLVSKSISKPIKELHNATKKLKKGEYDVNLKVRTKDELGELAKAFNNTTSALSKIDQEKKLLDRAKTQFLSITSHELRSPMTPMKAQLQMLEEGYFGELSEEQKDSLKVIIRNADRLDKIIADFLEVSRIEAARLKFDFKKLNPKKIVEETIKLMSAFAKEKNIKLVNNIDTLPEIEIDPDRVSQVLRNLINNAIKFSEENSKIVISAELKDDYILFSVRDYGFGMSKEDQIRVFEPFFQIDNPLIRRHGGTGLGLAICRGIVESQKGKIWVESKQGKGSTFYFTLPKEPVRKIEPIKILFSQKSIIDKKVRDEFKSILGPLGKSEYLELKNKNAINMKDLFEYVDSLIDNYIIDENQAFEFKNRINEIFGTDQEIIKDK